MIRTALRSVTAPWTALVVLGLAVVRFVQVGAPWRGDVEWTAGFLGAANFIVLTVLAGTVAFDTARANVPGRLHLVLLTGARPWKFIVTAALIPMSVVHLALWLGMMTITLTAPHDAAPTIGAILQPLVHIAAFVFIAAVGTLVGRYLPPLFAGAIGAMTAVVLTFDPWWGRTGEHFALLNVSGTSGTMVGNVSSWPYALTQILTFVGLSAIILLLPLKPTGGRLRPTWLTAGAVLVIFLLATLPLGRPAHRYLERPAMATDCRGTEPEVCGFQEQADQLDRVEPIIRKLVEAADSAGYDALVPRRVLPVLGHLQAQPPPPGTLTYPTTTIDETRQFDEIDPAHVAGALIEPLHCPGIFGEWPPPEEYFVASEDLVATWLALAGLGPPWPYSALGPAEVTEVLADFASCDGLE